MLERRGIISGYEGSKPRRVLVDEAELERFVKRHVRVTQQGLSSRANLGLIKRPSFPGASELLRRVCERRRLMPLLAVAMRRRRRRCAVARHGLGQTTS